MEELLQLISDVHDWAPESILVSVSLEPDGDDIEVGIYVGGFSVADGTLAEIPTFEQVVEGVTSMLSPLCALLTPPDGIVSQLETVLEQHKKGAR